LREFIYSSKGRGKGKEERKDKEEIKETRRREREKRRGKGREVRGRIFHPFPLLKPRSATGRQSLSPHWAANRLATPLAHIVEIYILKIKKCGPP